MSWTARHVWSVGEILTAANHNSNDADLDTVLHEQARKTTAKAVSATVAATDLLNGEITIPAGAISSAGALRARLTGDFLNNTGSSQTAPRWQLVVGGTTIFDTGASGTISTSATRMGWSFLIEMIQLGAADSQLWMIDGFLAGGANFATSPNAAFATGLGGSDSGASRWAAIYKGSSQTAIDMTTSETFVFNVINGVANASYETRLKGASVHVMP